MALLSEQAVQMIGDDLRLHRHVRARAARLHRKRSINRILLFGRWRSKRLGLDVERQQRLDLFEGLGLGQLGE